MTYNLHSGHALLLRPNASLLAAALLCFACSDSGGADTNVSGASTDDSSTSAGQGASDATGDSSSTGVDDSTSGATDDVVTGAGDQADDGGDEGCMADNQPDTRNGNDMCFSPFVRATARNAQDFLGCDCVECDGEMGFCSEGAHWFCEGTWFALEVDTCDSPSACPLVWLQEFESVEQQQCEAADGTYECTWTLQFSNYVREQKGFQGRDGSYRCEGMNVIGIFGPSELSAPFNPDTGILTWDGVDYRTR